MNTYDILFYRTGGTDRFTWHPARPDDLKDIDAMVERIRRMGYPVVKGKVSIGPPETYE